MSKTLTLTPTPNPNPNQALLASRHEHNPNPTPNPKQALLASRHEQEAAMRAAATLRQRLAATELAFEVS